MVSILCRRGGKALAVALLQLLSGEEIVFQIVGSMEANSLKNKISNESPVGAALMGARVGETIEVEMPTMTSHYRVLGIERNV